MGASMDGCRASVELASKYEHIYAAVGIHPDDYERLDKNQEFLDWLRNEALNNKKVVAIGEIGLDYYYDEPERELQKKWFARQLELANEVNKPVIIHSRDACADTIEY